jgi:anti-sigma factor RsiW
MIDDPPFEPDRALFTRWRATASGAGTATPDALDLAAYADGRLTDAAADAVEAALATDPELLDLLLALRQPVPQAIASAALIRSAKELVPQSRRAAGREAASRVNPWYAWGAIAAGLLIVAIGGFDLGMRTAYAVNAVVASDSPGDLLDPSSLSGDDFV